VSAPGRQALPGPRSRAPVRRGDIRPSGVNRRESSACAVLLAVLDHGPVARSTIARLTGLSPAAVSRQCGDLMKSGLLRETTGPYEQKVVGRPHVPIDIDVDRHLVCGVHIAVAHATLALMNPRGRIIALDRVPHVTTDPTRALSHIAERVPGFLAAHADNRVPLGLGVATGGWVDPAAGVIVAHPLLGWRDVPVRELLADRTGLDVRVDSHSRALARAEQLFGDSRSRSSIVHLFVGNVVDAAFGSGTALHQGPRSAAGAVAHLALPGRQDPCACGRLGCLQAAVSDRTLARRAAELAITRTPSFPELLALARAGEREAVGLFHERARLVGTAAAQLLDMFNPEVLVVVDQGLIHLPDCLTVLRDEVRARSALPRDQEDVVVAGSFGPDVLGVAAGTVALDMVYENPLRVPPPLRAGVRSSHHVPSGGRN
jgi:predicted NBD/HSP70 family sugar kinase